MPETAQNYELSFLRASKKVDISWGCLQFLCISLCRSLLKSMSYPFSEHAERWIPVETIFNFDALAYSGDCSQTGWYLLRRSSMSCISLCRRLLKSMTHPFSEHAERLILAETVFDVYSLTCRRLLKSMTYLFSEHADRLILAETVFKFYALAYAGDCSKVWVVLSHSMQKDWYWLRRSSKSMLCFMPSLSYPFSEHAEKLILAETVFKLYALSYTGPS